MAPEYTARFLSSLNDIAPSAWDALHGGHEPFVRHAFLSALEDSNSVGSIASGWVPEHLVIESEGQARAALPLYRKFDSYGEFIFDWAWAQASEGAGLPYYPKLVGAVPFTPASGTRLLVHPECKEPNMGAIIAEALREHCRREGLSGAHILFCREHEAEALSQAGFALRHSSQFHWQRDPSWVAFDDYLAALRHSQRKQVRKERERARSHGLRLSMRPIAELTERELAMLYGFYRHTVWEKGAIAYLTPQLFVALHEREACGAWVAMAHRDDTPVAAALFFRGDNALYGRYWGASEMLDALHFELCYYAPIELCIREQIDLFEAGAQGEHKLKRGLLPRRCYSAHYLAHPGLMSAVERAVDEERYHVARHITALGAHSPYRRDELPAPQQQSAAQELPR